MTRPRPRLTRRRLLALLACLGVSACSPDGPELASPSPSPSPPPPPDDPPPDPPREPPSESPAPPAPPGDYEPVPGDVYTDAKRVGGRFAQALTTYAAGEPLPGVLERAAAARRPGLDPATLAAAAAPVHHEEASSTGEVVYAQLGGLDPIGDPTSASTMVVVLQRLDTPAGEQVHTRTIDVRLRLADGGWVLDGLGDAGGQPVARPPVLPPAAARVLDDPRIDLPDSGRWDIHRGEIDARLLVAMADLAELASYSVCCLKSGHPINVFGTDRRSHHTGGRAMDIWAVDGVPVVHQQPQVDTPAHRVARALFDQGVVPEIGAPWAYDGPGGRSFENDVHRDHIHVAFRT